MKKIITLIMILIAMIVIPGCINDNEEVDIYASIYPVYFLTDYIVEDKMVVKQVYPTGADVHEYDPGNGREIVKMSKAKIMFYIGADLEGFIEKSKNTFATQPIKLVELSSHVKLCRQTSDGYSYLSNEELELTRGVADTHIWLDPLRMVKMAEVILTSIISIDPENEEFYQENAAELITKLKALDEEYVTKLSDESLNKIMLVDHDSYLYWEERYGIKRIRTRVDNESCESNPSNINEVVTKAKENNIKYIVTTANETVCGIIDKYAKTLEAKTVEMNHLSTLYRKEIKEGKDYFSIMRSNLDTLLKILPKK